MAEYKIDFNRGSDSNNGTSAPWKNLSKLASLTPVAGDVIALASDSWWYQENRVLFPAHTNGTQGSPILITSYDPAGGSNEKPRITLRKTLAAGDFTYEAGSNGWYFDTSTMVASGSLNWACFVRLGGEDGIRTENFTPNVTPFPSTPLTWKESARLLYVYAPAGQNPVDYYGSVEFGHSAAVFTAANSGNFLIVENITICDGGGLLYVYASTGTRNVIARNIQSDDATVPIRTLHDTGSNLSLDLRDCSFNESQSAHVAAFSSGVLPGSVRVFNNTFRGGNRGWPSGQVYVQTRIGSTNVSGNTMHGARYGTINMPFDGCAIYAESGSDGVIVSGNIVKDAHIAFIDNSGRSVTWMGNVVANCHAAIKVTDEDNVGSTNHRFYNNTCLVGAGIAAQGPDSTDYTGWRAYKSSGSGMTFDVRNNIIQNVTGTTYGAGILTPEVTYTGTFDRNCILGFPSTGDAEFSGTAPTLTNTVASDPLLDASYRPRAGSPVLEAGTKVAGVRLQDFYGKEIEGTPDIGAIQVYAARSAIASRSVITRTEATRDRSGDRAAYG